MHAAVAIDRFTGGRRDFANIEFADAESARRAKEAMHGQTMDGATIRCEPRSVTAY